LRKRRVFGLFMVLVLSFTSLPSYNYIVKADAAWSIAGNTDWTVVYAENDQNDYLQDQQTGSNSVSQDIVGDATYPAVYMHMDSETVAIRVRVSNNNGGTSDQDYAFKNFVFVGIDADCNGSIDFFLGAYNPSGSNGRIGIYSSDPGALNVGPSTTGIAGKPLLSFQPVRDENYAITATGDGSTFNSDADYFVSFSFSVNDIAQALAGTAYQSFSASTAFRFITGTASQDNSFNQDISGMDKNGWSSGRTWNSLNVFSKIMSADGTAAYYSVIFDKNTGDTEANPSVKAVTAGAVLGSLPVSPTKRGMYFQEWNTSADGTGTKVTSAYVVSADQTVYAIWSDKAVNTVTFFPNGGNFSGSTTEITVATFDGMVGDNMPPNPTYTNKYFMGWNTASNGSGNFVNSTTEITSNTSVYAIWSQSANKIAIFYNNVDAFGGTEITRVYSNGNSNNFNGSLPTINRTGYVFGGWFLNDMTCAGTAVTDIGAQGNYYAKWTPAVYQVTFDGNASGVSNLPASFTVSDGLFGQMPASPLLDGYTFIEWNRLANGTGEAIYPSSVITSNTTVYAIWKTAKSVAFDSNGGTTEVQTIPAVDGLLAYLPQPPERDGYTFLGWGTQTDSVSIVSLQDVSAYTTLYAVWSQIRDVTFDVNAGSWDGTLTTSKIVGTAYGSVLYLPRSPIRNGYTFSGWNTENTGLGSNFTLNSTVTADMTVYAMWTPINYTITYNLDGGSLSGVNPISYTIESADITLLNPTKENYTFAGWTGSGLAQESTNVTIQNGSTGNKSYSAVWTNVPTATVAPTATIPAAVTPSSITPTATTVPTSTPVPTATTAPTSTPVPTATTVPTSTPVPTATTVPTSTPAPTSTPVPTATTVPTSTPVPTATTVPTSTPVPTATTVPTSTPVPTATAAPTPTEIPEDTHSVEGTIVDDSVPAARVASAIVIIRQGNTVFGTAATDANGDFLIEGIPAGTYNLVMIKGDKTEIITVTVRADVPVTRLGTLLLPLGNASSQLVLNGDRTPAVVVGNLHPLAEEYFTELGEAGFAKVEMTVERTDESSAQADNNTGVITAIREINNTVSDNEIIGIYLDMVIDRYVRTDESVPWNYDGNIARTTGLIEIIIPLPDDLKGKSSYTIYRYHGNAVNIISQTANEDGEYLVYNSTTGELTLYVRNFSVYAIAYSEGGTSDTTGMAEENSASPEDTAETIWTDTNTAELTKTQSTAVSESTESSQNQLSEGKGTAEDSQNAVITDTKSAGTQKPDTTKEDILPETGDYRLWYYISSGILLTLSGILLLLFRKRETKEKAKMHSRQS